MRDFLEKHGAPLLLVLVTYLIGAFIAWDFNPSHWLAITTTMGRIGFIILLLFLLRAILEHYEDYL